MIHFAHMMEALAEIGNHCGPTKCGVCADCIQEFAKINREAFEELDIPADEAFEVAFCMGVIAERTSQNLLASKASMN